MLITRIKTALVLLVLGLSAIFLGGWFYTAFILLILLLASHEFVNVYNTGGYAPNRPILIVTVFLLVISRRLFEFQYMDVLLAVSFLIAMTVHTLQYENGRQTSALDFGLTILGILYFGVMGGYFISLMFLPGGRWWLLLTIGIICFSDSGAYLIGSHFGKHRILPRISPNKSWEGYIGGAIAGTIGGLLWALWFQLYNPQILLWHGLLLGFILGVLTPMGDFGESMIKRQFNVKDSSNLLPGHGGAMDRIDSWVWAVCISYYLILYIF
jgi:phosphatidate cytidylyltransferase